MTRRAGHAILGKAATQGAGLYVLQKGDEIEFPYFGPDKYETKVLTNNFHRQNMYFVLIFHRSGYANYACTRVPSF